MALSGWKVCRAENPVKKFDKLKRKDKEREENEWKNEKRKVDFVF